MSDSATAKDLIVVTADADAEFAIRDLLQRRETLSIREIKTTVRRFSGRDPGCYRRVHEFLRPSIKQFQHALVIFDRHGCGKENESRTSLEADVEDRLRLNGWADRSAVIVLDPELEAWVWSDSPEVDRILGWTAQQEDLRTWLREQNLWVEDEAKPKDPKLAMEQALRYVRKPRSSAIYSQLAKSVSLRRCTDPALDKLRETLQRWFPA